MMMSSAGDLIDAGRCRSIGIENSVIKPIFPASLRTAILQSMAPVEEKPLESRSSTGAARASTAPPLKILLVEDNAVNRKVAVRLLEKLGHTVLTAHNGREALDLVERIEWQADLIIMDVQMPEMDGYQATAIIREREKLRSGHMPIIAMTAHALDRDRERCLASGMDEYLTKPIQREKLLEVLERIGAGMVTTSV